MAKSWTGAVSNQRVFPRQEPLSKVETRTLGLCQIRFRKNELRVLERTLRERMDQLEVVRNQLWINIRADIPGWAIDDRKRW